MEKNQGLEHLEKVQSAQLTQEIVLFDLDGTLTDSAKGVIRSVQYMQEKMEMEEWSEADLRFIVGPPIFDSFYNELGMNAEEAERAFKFFRERYASIGLYENKLYDGIREMLDALKAKGKRMAVATSKNQSSAELILEHFEIAHYFEVIGGHAVERDTKAKVINYVLETMKADQEDVIMVGDRKFDVVGAHAIGIPAIAVEYGYGDRAEFEACGADYIVPTPAAVVNMF